MLPGMNFFKSKGRRKNYKGVSGNFSTIVIITLVIIGAYIMSGGGLPEPVPTYENGYRFADPLPNQPKDTPRGGMGFKELLFTLRPTNPPPFADDPQLVCANKAIVILADVSTSMTEPAPDGVAKLEHLKTSLTAFPSGLSPESLFGLYTFSSPNGGEPRERIPISLLSEAQTQLPTRVGEISPPDNAATNMRAGFTMLQERLQAAKIANPEHDFHVIFISDGVPENENFCDPAFTLTGTCNTTGDGRNYDKRYDPTGAYGNVDIPGQLKSSGTPIYSIAISNERDAEIFPELETLMQRISSGEEYYVKSAGGIDLANLFQRIKNSACTP